MPNALTIDQRLQRARDLLAEAEAIDLPESGQERGHALVHKHSVLNHATQFARQILPNQGGRPSHFGRGATAEQQSEAQRLLAAIEAARPALLDEARREAKKMGRPRRAEEIGERVTVRLTHEEIEQAKAAGGNLSAGLRMGLAALKRHQPQE